MEATLFALHVVVGALFVGHGAQKLFGWFGGYGLEGTAGFMESLGFRPGRLHALASGAAELGGGILLALGLLVPLAAVLLTAVMLVAVFTVHRGKGPFNENGGWELNLVYILATLTLAGVGAGDWSLDAVLDLDLAGTEWALGAAGAGVLGAIGAFASTRLSPAAEGQGTGGGRPQGA